MAKTQKPNDDEKIVKENVQKRFKNMFTGENEPLSNMSLKEVEALKARVAELETLVAGQQAVDSDVTPAEEPVVRSLPLVSAEKLRTDQPNPLALAAMNKFIGLWVTGISSAVGLAFFGVALYIVFVLQHGMMELSDKILLPYTVLMVIASLIGLYLVRHSRFLPGVWISYLTNVIVGPVLVVLVIKNFHFIMGGYLVFFSLLFITLVLPKPSKWWASLATAGAALAITGLEVWDPAFRLSTSQIQNFTLMILGPAALGFFLLFIIVRQLRYPQSTRSLRAVLFMAFFALSAALLLVIGGTAAITNYVNYQETLTTRQVLIAQDASKTVVNFIEDKFRALEAAASFENSAIEDPKRGEQTLRTLLGLQPAFRQAALLDPEGRQLANVSRQSSSLSPQFEAYLTEEVVVRTQDGQRFTGNIYIDDVTSEPQEVIAVPIYNGLGDFRGTLAVELNLKFMWDLVGQLEVGETGYAYVVDYQGNLIASGDVARVLRGENVKHVSEVEQFLRDPWYQISDITPGLVRYEGLLGEEVVGNYVPLVKPVWAVVTELPTREAYRPIIRSILTSGLMILVFGILAGLAGNFLARRLSAPLTELSRVATEISSGNLGLQAKVSGPTEIAQVASTFNAMTHQLHDLIGSLEQRVSDRTHDLELAAEVGRTVTARITQLSEMLSEAAEMIRARFDLYYTQIYLTDPTDERINLRAGTGDVGKELLERSHSLPVNPGSLNGRAVVEKQVQIVADTRENPNFLPNPLLPNTRSEMCVPLIVDEKVVGVLDMQSEQPGALSENNLPAFEALAGQLAIAIRNAALFAEAEELLSGAEMQMGRFTKEGWDNFLNAIHQAQRIGFAFDDSQVIRLRSETLPTSSNADRLNLPITITGAKVGEIQVPSTLNPNELELVAAVGDQLAQHIENLRLLAQAEIFRREAELAVRRLTREGWDTYLKSSDQPEIGYVYDLNQVQPFYENKSGNTNHFFKQPLIVRDETIGELQLDLPEAPAETIKLVSAVAQQLSSHLENLRLIEQNEKRAYELATVATVSTTASTLLDPDKLLQSVVDLTKERFGLYHVHVYLHEPAWNTLLLAAGAGEVGRKLVAEQHAIPLSLEQSLVARAARDREVIIVNDVNSEPGFLPNPLLPQTCAEMAVPMTVGDKLLGVFDVQSNSAIGFSDEDASIYVTLAAQVGVALQNARLYVEQAAHVTQLRELDRLKSSFLANMSHELRTPLNSILGFADVIIEELDGPLTENMSNDLRLIQKNGQHLLHLINDVLDMAKIEAGRMNLNPERFQAFEVLEEVTSITSSLASEKNLSLFIEQDSDCKVSIYADRTRLRQVMINLVNNAIKFTENGKIALKIASISGARILITVKDTGISIPPDKLEAIFQEFTQVDSSSTRKAGGTGLGLPISRRLVEMHGGRLWAESAGIPGEGSTFFVELPVEARITETIEKQVK